MFCGGFEAVANHFALLWLTVWVKFSRVHILNNGDILVQNNNPADVLSRGTDVASLAQNQLWWKGPAFLQSDKSAWPTTPISLPAKHSTDEARKSLNKTFVSQLYKSNDSKVKKHLETRT